MDAILGFLFQDIPEYFERDFKLNHLGVFAAMLFWGSLGWYVSRSRWFSNMFGDRLGPHIQMLGLVVFALLGALSAFFAISTANRVDYFQAEQSWRNLTIAWLASVAAYLPISYFSTLISLVAYNSKGRIVFLLVWLLATPIVGVFWFYFYLAYLCSTGRGCL